MPELSGLRREFNIYVEELKGLKGKEVPTIFFNRMSSIDWGHLLKTNSSYKNDIFFRPYDKEDS